MVKDKRGFTLVELLATITIIGIICIVIFPSVYGLISNNKTNSAKKIGDTLILATKKYVNDQKLDGTGCKIVSYDELKAKNYIKTAEINDVNCGNSNTYVSVDFNNKSRNYVYHLSCTNLSNVIDDGACTVDDFAPKTKTIVEHSSGFNAPDLGAGVNNKDFTNYPSKNGTQYPTVVPIRYNEKSKKWVKADVLNNKAKKYYWYDYKNGMWANMAIVKKGKAKEYYEASLGTEVKMDDILSMWVWIPRFVYHTLFVYSGSYNENAVDIKFIKENEGKYDDLNEKTSTQKCNVYEGRDTSLYCLPKAFTNSSGKGIKGFWVAKFVAGTPFVEEGENYVNPLVSDALTCNDHDNEPKADLFFKPNMSSYTCVGYVEAYNKMKSLTDTIKGNINPNIHMLRLFEFNTIINFTKSKYGLNNVKLDSNMTKTSLYYQNNHNNSATGAVYKDSKAYDYNSSEGLKSSTTKTVYGLYDIYGKQTYLASYRSIIFNQINSPSRLLKIDNNDAAIKDFDEEKDISYTQMGRSLQDYYFSSYIENNLGDFSEAELEEINSYCSSANPSLRKVFSNEYKENGIFTTMPDDLYKYYKFTNNATSYGMNDYTDLTLVYSYNENCTNYIMNHKERFKNFYDNIIDSEQNNTFRPTLIFDTSLFS